MIEIDVFRDERGVPRRLRVQGHAHFTEPEDGNDVVCAAVSALVGLLGIAFEELRPPAATVEGHDGFFELRVRREEPDVEFLLQAWLRSVRQLEENYSGWVRVEERPYIEETS